MKNTFAKFAVIAAVAAVPCFGTTLAAREHHDRGGNTAVRIVHEVLDFLKPAPVVVTPPAYHRPAPPPPRPHHHAPAPVKHHAHHPAPHHGGARR